MVSNQEVPEGGLVALLAQASTNDPDAFMRFYDLTAPIALRLELLRTADAERAAEALTSRFLQAWYRSGQHARSGLTPLAWLLSLSRTTPT